MSKTNQAIEWMGHAISAGIIEAIDWSDERIREYAEAQTSQCDEYGVTDETTTEAMREWARGAEPINEQDIEDYDNAPDIADIDPDWNADEEQETPDIEDYDNAPDIADIDPDWNADEEQAMGIEE